MRSGGVPKDLLTATRLARAPTLAEIRLNAGLTRQPCVHAIGLVSTSRGGTGQSRCPERRHSRSCYELHDARHLLDWATPSAELCRGRATVRLPRCAAFDSVQISLSTPGVSAPSWDRAGKQAGSENAHVGYEAN